MVILVGFCLSVSLVRGEVWAQNVSPLQRPITQKPSDGLRKTVLFLFMDSWATPIYQSLPWPTSTVQLCFPDMKPMAPSTHTRLVQRSGLSGRSCLLLYCTQVSSSENFKLDWAVFGSRVMGTESGSKVQKHWRHFIVNCNLLLSAYPPYLTMLTIFFQIPNLSNPRCFAELIRISLIHSGSRTLSLALKHDIIITTLSYVDSWC